MSKTILMMYITLSAPILAGILNMVWCKSKMLNRTKVPMDFNKNFIDGKRIFGDNKTWKGFIGYVLLNILCSILFGFIWNVFNLNNMNYFYINITNTFISNILIGFLLGLGYSLFELPNSFLKRRIGIEPGKNPKGIKKLLFIFLDQADSVFGCCLIVCLFYKMTFTFYMMYVILGAFTHIIFNMLLYCIGLRKNMF